MQVSAARGHLLREGERGEGGEGEKGERERVGEGRETAAKAKIKTGR